MAIQQRAPRYDRSGTWSAGVSRLTLQLRDRDVTLRPIHLPDAQSLLRHLSRPLVQRYATRCPSSLEGMRRFVRWAQAERRKGLNFTFGIVPVGASGPVGIIQLWAIERDFSTAEWGFVLSDQYWGTGVFASSARLVLNFAFDTLGVRRLEARAVDVDARGNGSLLKVGARREGLLREGFRDGNVVRDQVMWSILADDWRAGRAVRRVVN